MTNEQWANFILKTNELIVNSDLHQQSTLFNILSAINSLNNSLEQIFRITSNMTVSYKWSSNNYFENKPKSLITTHLHFKQLNCIILTLQKSNRNLNIWLSTKEWISYVNLMNCIMILR